MTQLYLFARIAGTNIAVRTEEVEAVVKITEVSPVPGVPSHIAGLSALRSRVLTMIDTGALIHGHPTSAGDRTLAIIADISGHSYGLMVEAVSDICAVTEGELPLRGQLEDAWTPFAQAMVENDQGPSLLVSLASFVEQAPVKIAA